jgi:BCD family chlorophyll transporter-like MFS transporter
MTGCAASALALLALAFGAQASAGFPLEPVVFVLGVCNGVFAVAAIGSMMDLVGRGGHRREGVRMGLWGAAQAIAFGLGGIGATLAVDVCRALFDDVALAYAIVFCVQAALFLYAARLAFRVYQPAPAETTGGFSPGRIALEMDQ